MSTPHRKFFTKSGKTVITSEETYSDDEVEWLKEIGRWSQQHHRYPIAVEVLVIAKHLGYKLPKDEQ